MYTQYEIADTMLEKLFTQMTITFVLIRKSIW